MSELGTLFVIFLLVYVAQCIWWVAPGASIFMAGPSGQGARKKQGFIWNAFDLAGVLANPFPPLSPLVISDWPDFQMEPEGFWYSPKEGQPVMLPWEKLAVTYTDSRLLCNGSPVMKAGEAQVRRYAELLLRIRKLKPAQRPPAIESWLRRSMNESAARRKLKLFRRRSLWLRILANLQFFLLFLAVPLGFGELGTRVLWPMVIAVAALSIAITLEFWMLHKALFTESGGARLKSAITVLLSPVAAVRACDAVSRDLLAGYHPLAVASVILPEQEFRSFAGEQLRACRFGNDSAVWYRERLEWSMEKLVRGRGMEPEDLMRPQREESNCMAYCPRCLAQYLKERDECADCGFRGLVLFPGTTRTSG